MYPSIITNKCQVISVQISIYNSPRVVRDGTDGMVGIMEWT